ncbi:hypothetical protein FHL15_009623 [Xylaria flabelliformis]|uniref:Uncharacterized protein n=1 Tax=Xylaria flabelliformis TaxID=2512241 RepID=A0A553HNB5_9PEZI|nr:hypothetical protein FHL15_009623 [Xylaria flabelliformis]
MMPSHAQDIRQANTETGADRGREDDASTLMEDELDASRNTHLCWSNFATNDRAYKLQTNIGLENRFDLQKELSRKVAAAESEWALKKPHRALFAKQETYSENLARRIFKLPACLPSKLGALLDCRFVATNKNPCIRRDWKVVMLEEIVGFMTDEGQQVPNGRLWGRRQFQPIQKWLVVIRGQDTRFSEKGFETFNTMTNPWFKIDEGLQDDGRNATQQHEGSGD